DGGFYIKNDEDTFKLKINGRFQPELFYARETLDDVANGHYQNRTSFSIRRAEAVFNASIRDKFSFNVGMKHATNSSNFNTLNVSGATGTYSFVPEFNITAGMVGLPLSIMADTSSKWFLLTSAPITDVQDDGIENFTISRLSFSIPDGLGLNFSGDIWKFFYSASVVNGNESNYTFNNGNKFSFGARVGFNILGAVPGSMTDFACSDSPNLTVSLGSMYQAKRNYMVNGGLATIKYMWTSSAGVALRWGGFALTTEGYYRRLRLTNPGGAIWARPTMDDIGYYGAVGYYIIPKTFEVALQAGQIFREGPDNNSNSFGGGLNYYIFDNNLKLQLSYIWT
ncbi:MAG: hypothetical protein COS89_05145, partial [Deltaproteobacteria bacterium CG07_land_8_20_14_0_80_38_7]